MRVDNQRFRILDDPISYTTTDSALRECSIDLRVTNLRACFAPQACSFEIGTSGPRQSRRAAALGWALRSLPNQNGQLGTVPSIDRIATRTGAHRFVWR